MYDNIPNDCVFTKLDSSFLNNCEIDLSKMPIPNIIPQSVSDMQRENTRIAKEISRSVNKRNKSFTDRMDTTNSLLEEQIRQYKDANNELKKQLEETRFQLKQLNDKESSQNLYIKELKADLREESLKRELAEGELNAKDWKLAFVALGSALLVLAVEHWQSIYKFILSLIGLKW